MELYIILYYNLAMMTELEMFQKYKEFAIQFKLNNDDIKKIWRIIKPIATHPEFIKRCNDPFFHHDIKSLGDHILCDTIVTYKLVKKYQAKNMQKINLQIALLIAMFHDFYELPWQNNHQKKTLPNKHGFVHPIEAAINAIYWFPQYFQNKEKAMLIIDGIVHHMFPLAVRAFDNKDMQLNNQDKYDQLDSRYKEMLKLSTDIGKIGHYSLRKSFFIEGRIMSSADKIVATRKDIGSIQGFLALISGKNKNIDKITKSKNKH